MRNSLVNGRKKPNGFWQDLYNVILAVEKIMYEQGLQKIPTYCEFERMGHSSIPRAISKYHGGSYYFRRIFGENNGKKIGIWANLEYRIRKAHELMEKTGTTVLPSRRVMNKLGYSYFGVAIMRYDGCFENFRRTLGEEINKHPYNDVDFGIRAAITLMNEHSLKQFPVRIRLVQLGYSSLANAIDRKYGGYKRFRQLLGERMQI